MAEERREYDVAPPAVLEAPPEAPPSGLPDAAPSGSRRRPRVRSLALNGLFVLACLYTLRLARDFLLPLRAVVDGDAGARVLALVLEQERARQAARARDATSFFGD